MNEGDVKLLMVIIFIIAIVVVLIVTGVLDPWLKQAGTVSERAVQNEMDQVQQEGEGTVNEVLCETFICTQDADCKPPSSAGQYCGTAGWCREGACTTEAPINYNY